MYMIMIMSMLIFLICNLLILLSNILSKKMKINFEKMTPFESGFNPKFMKRTSFSLRFFLISIIFLIFDVELALLMPMLTSFLVSYLLMWMIMSQIFMMILILGLIYEWYQGALNWI